MKISPSVVQKSKALLANAQHIVITNHISPDGDAMGSALGLQSILNDAGIVSKVIVPNAYPDFLHWMEGHEAVLCYEGNEEEADRIIAKADLIFHLDYNSLKRSGTMANALLASQANRIMIDHHQEPEDFVDVMISDSAMSSTCEMIYHFAKAIGMEAHITTEAANCLYTGIITDTGNFRFSGTTPQTHMVAAKLLEIGVKPHEIAGLVYDTNSENRLALLGRTLDKMEVLHNLNTAIMHLNQEDLAEFDFQKGDTEGFVNYGLSLHGIKLSVFIADKDGKVKMSFRSKGNFDVNKLARVHFNGGGHKNAAGALSSQNLEDTLSTLKKVLVDYADELQKN